MGEREVKAIEPEDEFEFSTGRRIYANNCIIGLSPSGEVSGGYDNPLWEAHLTEPWREDQTLLTNVERIELADYMIALWQKYRLRWSTAS